MSAELVGFEQTALQEGQPINTPESVRVIREKLHLGIVSVHATLYKADEVIDPTPIALFKGFGTASQAYAGFGHHTSLRGRDVLVMGTDRFEYPLNNQLVTQAKVVWTGMRWFMRKYGETQFDGYGHSMGTGSMIEFAKIKTDSLRSMITVGGVGQDGHHNLPHRLRGLKTCMRTEIIPEAGNLLAHKPTAFAKAEARHILSNLPLLLAEGLYTAPYNARPGIEKAKELNPSLKVGAINFENDAFFKHEDIMKQSGDLFDRVWLIPNAKHIHPNTHPDIHSAEHILSSAELNRRTFLRAIS